MKEALAAVKQIDAVFAYSDEAAQAAYEVAKSEEREKGTLFIGVNALPNIGQKLVEAGILNATFSCPTGGVEAVDTAVKLLAGQKPPKSITLETRSFTQKESNASETKSPNNTPGNASDNNSDNSKSGEKP
jgi:ABC-type sugar transport system substrate-binding protein